MDNVSETSRSSPETTFQTLSKKPTRPDRPCDICRKRKTRCVKEEYQEKCVLCTFHGLPCTYVDAPQPRKKRVADPDGAGAEKDLAKRLKGASASNDGANQDEPFNPGPAGSLLDRTLGLHRTTHFKYIGPSSVHEARLLELIHSMEDSGSKRAQDERKFRRVDESTTFISLLDKDTLFSSEIDQDLETIESLVRPYGPGLVDLYFRTVHPSYPILHKGVFLEKYVRNYKEFSPPLLAAVYLLAMDWWEYDRELSTHEKPDGLALLKIATKTMTGAIHRPKLSSAQAGLLLLQRAGGDSWVLTTQVVGIGEELGLHVDCLSWNIPEWEKGLRRRLGWAIYMQDKWGALIHGRPSHVVSSTWRLPDISLEDFPESGADDDDKEGSTEVEKGRLLFMHLAKLTQVMARALDTLYSPDQARIPEVLAGGGVQGLLELVKPLAMDLKQWATNLPQILRMEDVKTRKLCSNGHLHLCYFVTEIIIHRYIIRSLTPETPDALRHLCREAGKARLEHAINFVDALRPEHLQGFWWFASPKSLAFIRTYGGLLWATSETDEEAEFYRTRLEEYRWSLRVRAKGVGFVTAALREMEENLQDLDMSLSPSAIKFTMVRSPESQLHVSPGAMPPDIESAFGAESAGNPQVPVFDTVDGNVDFAILGVDTSHDFFSAVGDEALLYSDLTQTDPGP